MKKPKSNFPVLECGQSPVFFCLRLPGGEKTLKDNIPALEQARRALANMVMMPKVAVLGIITRDREYLAGRRERGMKENKIFVREFGTA